MICKTLGKILRKKAKYQGDYEDYDDYDAANENYDATKEVELTSIPEFISTAESMMIDEGDTIKLDCIVDKLGRFQFMQKVDQAVQYNLQIILSSCGRRVIRSLPSMTNCSKKMKMIERRLRKCQMVTN